MGDGWFARVVIDECIPHSSTSLDALPIFFIEMEIEAPECEDEKDAQSGTAVILTETSNAARVIAAPHNSGHVSPDVFAQKSSICFAKKNLSGRNQFPKAGRGMRQNISSLFLNCRCSKTNTEEVRNRKRKSESCKKTIREERRKKLNGARATERNQESRKIAREGKRERGDENRRRRESPSSMEVHFIEMMILTLGKIQGEQNSSRTLINNMPLSFRRYWNGMVLPENQFVSALVSFSTFSPSYNFSLLTIVFLSLFFSSRGPNPSAVSFSDSFSIYRCPFPSSSTSVLALLFYPLSI